MVIPSTVINIFNFTYNNRDYRIFVLKRANNCGDAMFVANTIFSVLTSDCIIKYCDYYDDIAFVKFSNGKDRRMDLINDSTVRKYIDIIREEDNNKPEVNEFLNAFVKFIEDVIYPNVEGREVEE